MAILPDNLRIVLVENHPEPGAGVYTLGH